MPDAPLTTLCAICHTSAPKYTCPGCATPTCSLPCAQRHKAWADCSGRRDPTAFMPIAKLKTAAGIDHDYNFLSGIERTRERNQREIVEDKGLFTEKALGKDLDEEKKWAKEWFGEEVKFVKKGGNNSRQQQKRQREEGSEHESEDENVPGSHARRVRVRFGDQNIEVVYAPKGLVRQRENKTTWHRASKKISWSVEWFIYDQIATASSSTTPNEQNQSQQKPLRIRHKALEQTPLYHALGASLAYHNRLSLHTSAHSDDDDEEESTTQRKHRHALIKEVKTESRRTAAQDAHTTAFSPTPPYPTQNPYTSAWDLDRAATTTSWTADEETDAKRQWRFYLLRPLTPGVRPAAGGARELIPLGSEENVAHALTGRTVLEYPTFYVLPPSATPELLPEGFVLGSTERRAANPKNKGGQKRKAGPDGDENGDGALPAKNSRRGGKAGGARGRGGRGGRGRRLEMTRRPREEEEVEEGEVVSDEERTNLHPSRRRGRQTEQKRQETHGGLETHDAIAPQAAANSAMSAEELGTMDLEHNDIDIGARSAPKPAAPKPSLGLVDYGSDSSEDKSEASEDEDEDVDFASLKPENPELVASAIHEILGLLT